MARRKPPGQMQRWIVISILGLLGLSAWTIQQDFSFRDQQSLVNWEPGEPMPVAEAWPPLWVYYPFVILLASLVIGGPVLLLKDALRKSRLEKAQW